MADHLRDATKKVDFILREDAVQCAEDIADDLFDSASDGARIVAKWLKDIPAADVVEKTEWDKLMFLVDAANQILEAAKWISVKERLPEDRRSVLVYCPYNKGTYTAYYDDFNDEWYYFGCGGGIEVYYTVTHWMLLPEPPKEGGGEDGQR